jgi:hypothetical protein
MADNTFYFLAALALGVAFMSKGSSKVARGFRNNNPFNIKKTSDAWKGLAPFQTDNVFFVFDSMPWGVRAGYRILKTYKDKYGINTIEGIIKRFAPSSENPTQKYIDYVSRRVGVGPLKQLTDDEVLKVGEAIIAFENGNSPFSLTELEEWRRMQ